MERWHAFVAGKSGGHILPCISIANNMIKQDSSTKILFFITNSMLDHNIVNSYPFISNVIPLPLKAISLTCWWKLPWSALLILWSMLVALKTLWTHKPKSITSMGGFVSIPVCLAAKLLRIPITLFELNVEPGKAVSLLAPWSNRLHICFEQTKDYFPKQSVTLVEYPVRFDISAKEITFHQARKHLQLNIDKKTIFIMGGSQGSLFLNSLIKQWIMNNPDQHESIQIIHQTGPHESTQWQSWYDALRITAITFVYNDSIEYCYQAADLIVCRAGAGTLFEIKWFGKKSICIPLQTVTTMHQQRNAGVMHQLYNDIKILNQQELKQNPALFHELVTAMLASL